MLIFHSRIAPDLFKIGQYCTSCALCTYRGGRSSGRVLLTLAGRFSTLISHMASSFGIWILDTRGHHGENSTWGWAARGSQKEHANWTQERKIPGVWGHSGQDVGLFLPLQAKWYQLFSVTYTDPASPAPAQVHCSAYNTFPQALQWLAPSCHTGLRLKAPPESLLWIL